MRNGYLIEIADLDAGLLVRDGDGYAFVAVSPRFHSLDGTRFASALAAERAAWTLYRSRANRRLAA